MNRELLWIYAASRRARAAFLLVHLLLVLLVPAVLAGSQSGGVFIVVSITLIKKGTYDIKLQNPRTGYIHSVTLYVSISLSFKVGDRIEERRDQRGGVVLIPIRDDGGGEGDNDDDDEGDHYQPIGYPTPPEQDPKNTDLLRPKTEGPLKGYIVSPIGNLRVTNAYNAPADKPLSKSSIEPGFCDALANGSFTEDFKKPAAPVIRGGRPDLQTSLAAGQDPLEAPMVAGKSLNPADKGLTSDGQGKITTDRRGGVAVLRDGKVVIGRQNGRSFQQINRSFGGHVWDFMGGGAMLLENNRLVDTTDLFEQQGFVDQQSGRVLYNKDGTPRTGFAAGQFVNAQHTLVGIKNGQAYLIVSPNRDGRQIQRELKQDGFSHAVMFDGGRGFYFTDGKTEIKGRRGVKDWGNSLGLCVQLP